MDIAVIYGQNHKGNTWALTKLFLDRFRECGARVTEFFLPDGQIGYCTGCTSCIMKDEKSCPHFPAVQAIVAAIDGADLIIVSSPTYAMGMTGQLKTLFDHLAYRFMSHRPDPSMFRKQALAVSTAAGAGMGRTTKAIADNLFWWGAARTYRCGLRIASPDFGHIPAKRMKKIERRADRIARKITSGRQRARAGIKTRFIFSFMRLGQKHNDWNPVDKEHWQNLGWLGRTRPW